MPTFRERIENNLPVFFLATLATGFAAGFASYRAIQEAGNVVQIRQSDLDRLKREAVAGPATDSLPPAVNGSGPPKLLRPSRRHKVQSSFLMARFPS